MYTAIRVRRNTSIIIFDYIHLCTVYLVTRYRSVVLMINFGTRMNVYNRYDSELEPETRGWHSVLDFTEYSAVEPPLAKGKRITCPRPCT